MRSYPISVSLRLGPIVHTRNSHIWCGPACICSISGLDTKLVHQCIREVLGHDVTGMFEWEVRRVLRALGYASRPYKKGAWLTFEDWLRKYSALFKDRPAIVTVAHTELNHFVAVRGGRFIDNSLAKPVPLSKAKHKKARVMSFLLVELQGKPRGHD